MDEGFTGCADILERCLTHPHVSWIGMEGAFRLVDAPSHIVKRAVDAAARFPDLVADLCSRRRRLQTSVLRRLLASEEPLVRVAAVTGEWFAVPRGQVRPEIKSSWCDAIVRTSAKDLDAIKRASSLDYSLGEILHSQPEIGFDWLKSLFSSAEEYPYLPVDGPIGKAIDALEREQRIALITTLQHVRLIIDPDALPSRVVGDDAEVYRCLLASDPLRRVHLAPLRDPSRTAWQEFARCALRAGYSPDDVAEASFPIETRIDEQTRDLDRYRVEFENLLRKGPRDLTSVATAGVRFAEKRTRDAQERARRRAVNGL